LQELFLEKLAYKSATQTLGDRRATVAYNDVGAESPQTRLFWRAFVSHRKLFWASHVTHG